MSRDMNKLKLLIDKAKQIVSDFEDALGWKESDVSLTEMETLSVCPYNDSHIMPQKSLENHLKKCKWRNYGYTKEEVKEIVESESSLMNGPTISLDEVVAEVAPGTIPLRNHEVYVSTLTREERLRVYNEILSRLKHNKQNLEDPFLYKDLDEKSQQTSSASTEKTNIELIKELRDHKRRRQSYRAKNVHVTKRSQTEVLRDILSIHMEELRLRWNPELRSTSADEPVPSDKSVSKLNEKERSSRSEGTSHELRREKVDSKSPKRIGDDDNKKYEQNPRAHDISDRSRERKHEKRSHHHHHHRRRDHHDHSYKHKKHKRKYDDEDHVKHKKHKKSSH